MSRKLPLIPTLVVLAAVATMVALGIWQLQRAEWKEGLLARFHQAQTMSSAVPWPRSPEWSGGEVGGFIGPAGKGVRLVAAPAQAGLAQLAAPDPNDVPDNHLAYAFQWFFFAITALVIYGLALRRKWRGERNG